MASVDIKITVTDATGPGTQTSRQNLSAVRSVAEDMHKSFDAVSGAVTKFTDTTSIGAQTSRQNLSTVRSNVDDTRKSFDSVTGSVVKFTAAIGGLAAVQAVGESLLATGLTSEKLSAQFKVASGTAQLAAVDITQIRNAANGLGLEFQTTASAFGKFLLAAKNTSIEGAVAKQTFLDISGALASMKLSGDESGRVFAQVQQSLAKGKVELEDMKIIAEAGIPIFNILAQALGKSQAEIMDMMGDGKLLAADVWPSVGKAMKEGFGTGPIDGAQAAINRFKNALFETKEQFAREWQPAFSAGLNLLTNNIGALGTGLVGAFSAIGAGKIAGAATTRATTSNAAVATDVVGSEMLVARTAATERLAAAETLRLKALYNTAAAEVQQAATDAYRNGTINSYTAAKERLILVEKQHLASALAETAATEAAEYAQFRHSLVLNQATAGYRVMSIASRAATGAVAAFSGAVAFLGGPVGAIITVLGLAATAWSVYSGKQKQAADEARAAGKELQAQADAIRERDRLAQIGDKRVAFSDKNQAFINQVEQAQALKAAGYTPNKIPGFDSLAAAEAELAKRRANQAIIGADTNRQAAENKAREDAAATARENELQEKLADERRKLDQTRMKNRIDAIKDNNDQQLSMLKDWNSQGLLTTAGYYDRQRDLLKSTNAAELAEIRSHRFMLQSQMSSATDPEKRLKLKIELESNTGQMEKLQRDQQDRLDKLTSESEKAQRAMKDSFDGYAADRLEKEMLFVEAAQKRIDIEQRGETFQRVARQAQAGDAASQMALNDLLYKQSLQLFEARSKENSAVLDAQASLLNYSQNYVEAVDKQIQKEQQSLEYELLRGAAQKKNANAMAIMAAKELEFENKKLDAKQKVLAAERAVADAIFEEQQQIAKLNGAGQEMLDAERNLNDSKKKRLELQDQLNRAILNGATLEINALNTKLALQDRENKLLERKATLLEQVGILSGQIVGFDNGKAIYANAGGSFNNGAAVDQYQSPADVLRNGQQNSTSPSYSTANAADNYVFDYWGEKVDKNTGMRVDPFGLNKVSGARANGGSVAPYATYQINEDGTEYLTMGGKGGYITPAGQTPPGTLQTAPSITIQGGIPITIVGSNKNPAEIADEVARVVVSRINQLQSQRFRKTG